MFGLFFVTSSVTFDDSISSYFDEIWSNRISIPRSVFPSPLLFGTLLTVLPFFAKRVGNSDARNFREISSLE